MSANFSILTKGVILYNNRKLEFEENNFPAKRDEMQKSVKISAIIGFSVKIASFYSFLPSKLKTIKRCIF